MDTNKYVIEKAFEQSFTHYKEHIVKGVLETGGLAPTVIVLHMNSDETPDGQKAYGVQGVSMHPDINQHNKMRDYITALGNKYGRKLVAGIEKDLPVAILVFAEAWVGNKVKSPDDVKPIQDDKGNPINGSTERLLATGSTATGKDLFVAYDIVRDGEGNIIDLVEDTDMDGDKVSNPMLHNFYLTIGKHLHKAGKFDQFEGDDNDA